MLLLALKVNYFIAENCQIISANELSYVLELDDFEKENEEKQELDENKKIHQPIIKTCFTEDLYSKINLIGLQKDYRNLHFEFTTPPPELN